MQSLDAFDIHFRHLQRERLAEATADRLAAQLPERSAARGTISRIACHVILRLATRVSLTAGLLLPRNQLARVGATTARELSTEPGACMDIRTSGPSFLNRVGVGRCAGQCQSAPEK